MVLLDYGVKVTTKKTFLEFEGLGYFIGDLKLSTVCKIVSKRIPFWCLVKKKSCREKRKAGFYSFFRLVQ